MKKIIYILFFNIFFISILNASQIVCEETDEDLGSVTITCPNGSLIQSIDFDSYGTPQGTCGNYTVGDCHCVPSDTNGWVGTNSQTFNAHNGVCDVGDPCQGTFKDRFVQVTCGPINGCTDAAACNYNQNADVDDGSCLVPVDCETCNGSDNLGSGSIQNNDDDGDGVCNDAEVLGCTNENSANYDIDATDDDGSCHPYISNPIDNITIDELKLKSKSILFNISIIWIN